MNIYWDKSWQIFALERLALAARVNPTNQAPSGDEANKT